MCEARKNTRKVTTWLEENFGRELTTLEEALLSWLSDDEVLEFAEANYDYEDEEDEDDDCELDDDEEEELIDSMYHNCSEDELRKMGVFGDEDDDDYEDDDDDLNF